MMDGLFLLNKGTQEDKIRFFFNAYDLDGKLAATITIPLTKIRALIET